MSAIAQFIKIPKAAVESLTKAAVTQKRILGTPRDTFHDYLRQIGQEVAEYRWSGYVLTTLLMYLAKNHQIDLMKSEYDALAMTLSTARQASYVVLTSGQKTKYLDQLDALSVSEDALRDYYNAFNAANEPTAGKPMLAGLKPLRDALSEVDDSSLVLLSIG
jgi:hypothetical protein